MNEAKFTRFRAQISEIDLKSLLKQAVQNLSSQEGAYRLQIKTTIEGLLPFFSDEKQLLMIMNNIISNAIKYQHVHEPHPVLDIHIEIGAEKATFNFKDNGIGIPKENFSRIFDMFYRVPDVKADGSGLGLYIVREIVKKLKGKIGVTSNPGDGTCFTIELPNRIDPDLLRKISRMVQNSK